MISGSAGHRATFAVLVLVIIAVNLPQSVVVPVLPHLQADYGTSQVTATWLITGFLLSSGVATPILGRLGDGHSRRGVLLVALAAILVGSLGSAVAPTIGWAILARFVQGIGGGAVPVAFSVLREVMPPARLHYGVAVLATVGSIAFSGGIVAAGPLLATWGRVALFGLCALVALAAAAGVVLAVPPRADSAHADLFGLRPPFLFAGGLVCLLLAISESSSRGSTSPMVLTLTGAAVVGALGWIVEERRAAVPFIDLAMLRARGMWTSNLVAFLAGISLFGSAAALPQLLQTPRGTGYGVGADLDTVGLLMMPIALAAFLTSLCTGYLHRRLLAQHILLLGALCSGASFLGIAMVRNTPASIVVWCVLQGIGNGLILSTVATVVVASVPATQTGVANGMNNNIRTLGGSFGAAVTATILASHSTGSTVSQRGFVTAFVVMAIAMGFSGLAALLIPTPRPLS